MFIILMIGAFTFESGALRLSFQDDLAPQHKVAVMISGTFHRYIVESSMKHLVRPMVVQGHTVDVYVGLNKESHTPWARYDTKPIIIDPFFAGVEHSPKDAQERVNQLVSDVGGQLRNFQLYDHVDITSSLPANGAEHYPFTTYSRNNGSGNVNFLKLFKVLEDLWGELEKEEERSGRYSHVLIMRDDALWHDDFDLNKLLRMENQKPFVMVQDCGGKSGTTGHKANKMQDFAFFLSRSAAPYFAQTYTTITQKTCDGLTKLSPACGGRFAASEDFFQSLAVQSHLDIFKVDPSYIPFTPAKYYTDSETKTSLCIHYECNSESFTEMVPVCKKVWAQGGRRRKGSFHQRFPAQTTSHRKLALEYAHSFLMVLYDSRFKKSTPQVSLLAMTSVGIMFIMILSTIVIHHVKTRECESLSNVYQTVLKYAYGCRWMLCSWLIILLNKWLFSPSPRGLGFNFPVLLLFFQMAFATFFTQTAWLLTPRWFDAGPLHNDAEPGRSFHAISKTDWAKGVVPVAICMAASISLSSFGLSLNSVQMVQAVKMADCGVVYLIAIFLGRDYFAWRKAGAVLIPVTGVLCFIHGEITFHSFSLTGLIFQLIALMGDACRVVLIERFMACSNVRLNPISSLYLLAPVICVIVAFFAEWSAASLWWSTQGNFWVAAIILLNGLVATLLNIALFTFLQCAGSTFVSLMGALKDLSLIFIGALVFQDHLEGIHYMAVGLILLGIVAYDNAVAHESAQDSIKA